MNRYIFLMTSVIILFSTACSDNENIPEIDNKVELIIDSNLLTVINLMKPVAADQDLVLSLLNEGIEENISKHTGFISANVHKSLDNNYVINYAQWRSEEDLQATADLINSGGVPKLAEAFSLSSPDFHPFQLTAQFKPVDTKTFIDTKGTLLTIINVLHPLEGVTLSELAQLLKVGIQEDVVNQPGFISATIHESLDNDYIINYAQWKDEASLNAFVEILQSGNAPKLGNAFGSATVDFHPFAIVGSHSEK